MSDFGKGCYVDSTPLPNDVADSLGIEIDSLVLDAGYLSKELIEAFPVGAGKTIIGRMPARKGYPHKQHGKRMI